MPYVVLGLCVVVGLLLMGRWLLNADPRQIVTAAKWTAGLLSVALVVSLAVAGLRSLAVVAFVALLVLFKGGSIVRAARNAAKTARGPTPGKTTGVRTRWLAMRLDHDTGAMDGEVLLGPFAGRMLSDLSREELASLAAELDGDTESRQVFDAWLDRMGADMGTESSSSREDSAPPPGADRDSAMSVAQAREILGVGEDADEAEIREAHRRLMMANHPDHGGSSWLAAQINAAKDMLLRTG